MSFEMRTKKPSSGNKYYIRKASGGYSNAIKGSPTDSECDVLANCVGYAYGRFNEIGGYGNCKYLAPVNAENFIQYKGSCEVGQAPKPGACMVWRKGATLNGSDGAGHVAIVEKVVSATEVITSESGYGSSKPFWNSTRKKGSGNWGAGSGYEFLGFIYNPAVSEEETTFEAPAETNNETVIYDFLTKTMGLNCAAACGVIANFNAESALNPKNLQNSYEKSLGYTDSAYTAAVDSGAYDNFVKDAAGYGLAQWTYWSRKQKLLEYAKSKGASIGDLVMQLEFFAQEVKGYSSVWKCLQTVENTAEGAYKAAYNVCYSYEAPAAKETSSVTRGNAAKTYFAKYTGKNTASAETPSTEAAFKEGDLVKLSSDAKYYSGKTIPDWVRAQNWYIKEDSVGDRAVIDKNEKGGNSICSPVNTKYLTLVKRKQEDFAAYDVRVDITDLNIRTGAGTNFDRTGKFTGKGVFTIVAESAGSGSVKGWGKLKSGAGWISLDYCTKIEITPAAKPAADVFTKDDVGKKVKCKPGVTKFANGTKMLDFVPKATLYIRAVEQGGKILLVSTEPTKEVYTGRVNASDMQRV